MKSFGKYNVFRCSAIAESDNNDESKRQDALLVIGSDGTETTQYVVFGHDMPNDDEGFAEICEDPTAWEGADENVRCPELGTGSCPWKDYEW